MVDATNGFDAASTSADAGRANGAGVVPAPADLIALAKRLHELGAERATIEKLAAKFGVKQATLEGWARREQPFGPEHADIAVGVEAALQGWIARLEAEKEEAAQARPNGAGQKAQSSSGPGDADAAWEEMQKKQRERQGGRAARDDPGVLRERLDEALRRLREATPRAVSALRGLIPMPEGGGLEFDPDCDEPMMLPPQVTELLVRGDVTVTVGDPNVGKSQLLSATALAIAHDAVTELLGEPGDGWLGAALFASNEEKPSYVRARWRELIRKLPLEKRKKRDKLILWEKPLVPGRFENGLLVPTEDGCEFVERLADWAEQGIHFAYIGLDPLSSLFSGINENDAPQTGDAVRFLKRIAEAAYAALEASHHTSKATRGEETATASRGSTGTEAASDHMSTFIALPEGEHKALGFPPDKLERILRRKGVRSRGKRAGARYFEREIVGVVAEDERFPGKLAAGTVAIVTPVMLPAKTGLDADDVQRWLWEANQGAGERRLTRGQRMAGRPGAAVLYVMEKGDCDRKTAETLIDKLVDDGKARLENVWISTNNRPVVIAEPPPSPTGEGEDAAY
jgi:hypothetical protein